MPEPISFIYLCKCVSSQLLTDRLTIMSFSADNWLAIIKICGAISNLTLYQLCTAPTCSYYHAFLVSSKASNLSPSRSNSASCFFENISRSELLDKATYNRFNQGFNVPVVGSDNPCHIKSDRNTCVVGKIYCSNLSSQNMAIEISSKVSALLFGDESSNLMRMMNVRGISNECWETIWKARSNSSGSYWIKACIDLHTDKF
jgi:hypothetical protein